MIIRHTTITDKTDFLAAAELVKRLGGSDTAPSDLLFFDIETTGLSAESSFLYLIGCLYLEGEELILAQFFSEGISEEAHLIAEFDALLLEHPILVHFNGATFDIPYISKKRHKLGIPEPDFKVGSFDIYKTLHPYKAFLGTGSMSQKRLEAFCGLNRRDMYDGGELIGFYNRYIAMKRLESLQKRSAGEYTPSGFSGLTTAGSETSDELLECLFLHNYEDVLNMPIVARLLALPDFLQGGYAIEGLTLSGTSPLKDAQSADKENEPLKLSFVRVDDRESVEISVRPLSHLLEFAFGRKHGCSCNPSNEIVAGYKDGHCIITVPVITEELKLFYPDHKNYYYLPAEDYAVHKSIGEFMNKEYRTSCKADKCYTRHSMRFLPLAGAIGKKDTFPFKIFKRFYNDKYAYVSADEILTSPALTSVFVRRIVENLN